MKRCLLCDQEKPEEEFGINHAMRDGLMPYCRNCYNEKKRRLSYIDPHYAELNRKYGRAWFKEARRTILYRLGGKCVVCGFDDERALQVDHINGGGLKEMRETNHYRFCKKLLTLPEEELKQQYQLLCANHNMIKKVEKKEHPFKDGVAISRQPKRLSVK